MIELEAADHRTWPKAVAKSTGGHYALSLGGPGKPFCPGGPGLSDVSVDVLEADGLLAGGFARIP